MAVTACPSDTSGARLKDSVTAGNWPWWFTDSDVARRPLQQLLEVQVLQGVLVLGARGPAADAHVLHRLQIEVDPLHAGELGTQVGDDLVGSPLALAERLELHEHEAVVQRAVPSD